MIRVTVELLAEGDEQAVQRLGTVEIENVGGRHPETGDYHVALLEGGHIVKRGTIAGFPRKAQDAYQLAHRALAELL